MTASKRISRHRLPSPYRALMTILWAMPVFLFVIAIIAGHGVTPFLFDVRLLLLVSLMLAPSWYVWRQGVDVVEDGLIIHGIWPKHYLYRHLGGWSVKTTPQGRILTIWRDNQSIILQTHAKHLSALSSLLEALAQHLRNRSAFVDGG